MDKIESIEQYNWAVQRVEELLPLVTDETPATDKNSIELERLSNMVADYSDIHFAIGTPSLSDILKLRMAEMGLTIARLAKMLNVSTDNMKKYLSGEKEPTLTIGRDISTKLGVDAHIVLGV